MLLTDTILIKRSLDTKKFILYDFFFMTFKNKKICCINQNTSTFERVYNEKDYEGTFWNVENILSRANKCTGTYKNNSSSYVPKIGALY